uniref:DUF1009 domain-containing protein n=1 Tax=Magnetococcus massalia (strain MO-1) TaxID=451514 RepID=A0A1S7LE03_MAGMO|nr:Conserved protein of unknown function [Candidatus Magnetococcus massalia]
MRGALKKLLGKLRSRLWLHGLASPHDALIPEPVEGEAPAICVGLIAGSGRLPLMLAEQLALLDKPQEASSPPAVRFVIAAHREEADSTIADYGAETLWVRLGQFKRIIRFFHEQGVTHVVMAGGINKVRIWSVRPDSLALRIVAGLKHMHDDHLLRAISDAFEARGFMVAAAADFIPALLAPLGQWGSHTPTEAQWTDIAFGWQMAKAVGDLDIGQGVVVHDRVVLAVEAVEGTDRLIKRVGKFARHGGILVKVSKPDQDMRLDTPTVGVGTIRALHEAGLSGLAVEAGRTHVIDLAEMVAEADKLGLFVVACNQKMLDALES